MNGIDVALAALIAAVVIHRRWLIAHIDRHKPDSERRRW